MLPYDYPLFRPPSEANSLIFQITLGCSRNLCTFCGMYKGKQFRVKPVAEVCAQIDTIPAPLCNHVQRVFLADGDAVVYPFDGLVRILDRLGQVFPNLGRVGAYASPGSLAGKSLTELQVLREKKLRILYFGLESGDDRVLQAINKGFSASCMADEALKAREAGIKLSVTAILGLGGRVRSLDHARATAAWVNRVSPEFFSLLTLFHRHNEDFIRSVTPCTRRDILVEARELLCCLSPEKTILRSNHVSNFLSLSGTLPRDHRRLVADVDAAFACAGAIPGYLDGVPDYGEEYY